MHDESSNSEVEEQGEHDVSIKNDKNNILTKEERQRALAKRIQESYQFSIPKDDPTVLRSRLKLNIEDGAVTQKYFPTITEYEVATGVEGRRLPQEGLKEVTDYVSRVTKSTLLQCPEYQVGVKEMRDNLDPSNIFHKYSMDNLFAANFMFNRGDMTIRFNTSNDSNDFTLVVKDGSVTERVFCEDSEDRSALNYQRSEEVGDSVAFLHEYDTEEALAGVEQILERIREAGLLSREIPEGLYKSKDAVWRRILDESNIQDLVVKAATLGGTLSVLATNPSVLHAIGTGTAVALVGYDTWKKAGNSENTLRTEAESIIDMGENDWGHFHK